MLRFLDRTGILEKYWEHVNGVMQPLLEEGEVSCFVHLYSLMLDLGSSFFHFFLTKFLELLPEEGCEELTHILDLVSGSDGSLYRFVWMSIVKGRILTLCKSGITFTSREDCLTNGSRYQPSIDTTSGEVLMLSWERVRSGCDRKGPQPWLWTKNENPREGSMKIGETVYKYLHAGEEYIFQMPWTVFDNNKHLYIYYIHAYDIWFYSYIKEIYDAYHDHSFHA